MNQKTEHLRKKLTMNQNKVNYFCKNVIVKNF